MKLNLNFDGFTKLRDWWKTVLSNFEIIQTECNKTRQIADNACTKEEAKAYINEFIGLSDEYMAAIEAFTDLYKENESAVAAMEEVFGERLKYYSKEELFDANEAIGEDAIFFCKAETENTPSNQTGILISKTDNKQMWIEENGEIYYRQLIDDAWGEWKTILQEFINEFQSQIADLKQNKADVNLVNGTWETLGSILVSGTFPTSKTGKSYSFEIPCENSTIDKYNHFRFICKSGASFKAISSTNGNFANTTTAVVKCGGQEVVSAFANTTDYPQIEYILTEDTNNEITVNFLEKITIGGSYTDNGYYNKKNFALVKNIIIECKEAHSEGYGALECSATFELQGRR